MSVTISLVISMAGLDEGLERRVIMAARLLEASRIQARIEPWDGTRRDILIADMNDAYGRAAYAVAKRRGDAILAVSRNAEPLDDGTPTLATACQVVELQNRMRQIALTLKSGGATAESTSAASASTNPPGGLLGLLAMPGEFRDSFIAKRGTYSVLVRRAASRIMGRSHSDLAAARSTFLDPAWTAHTDGHDEFLAGDLVPLSLDAFLIGACELNERKLADIPGQLQLAHWPDLGTLADNLPAMQLSALLTRNRLSVDELARVSKIDRVRVNAFCWAMRAAGLFDAKPVVSVATAPSTDSGASRSIISRLARRFGLRFGAEGANV